MKINIILVLILIGLAYCRNAPRNKYENPDCKKLNNQAMDSLVFYKTEFNKKKSTLESALKLLDEAIKCDSNSYSIKFNKVAVLCELGQFHQAVKLVDKLILEKDSSLLLVKAPIYDRLDEQDSLVITYKMAYRYYVGKLKDDPQNPDVIFGKVFSQSKIYGKESVRSEINLYLKKYPNDLNLKALLEDILR